MGHKGSLGAVAHITQLLNTSPSPFNTSLYEYKMPEAQFTPIYLGVTLDRSTLT